MIKNIIRENFYVYYIIILIILNLLNVIFDLIYIFDNISIL